MTTKKEEMAREYIGSDIDDALGNIDSIRKLLPEAHLQAEDDLLRHLEEAGAALENARAFLEES